MHLHLDALGGVAGDMFAACLLHARPDAADRVATAVRLAAGVDCTTVAHDDGTLTGLRFTVDAPERAPHGHAHWSSIRRRLDDGTLDADIARHAIGIFAVLAAAEARVHGTAPDDVVFHEVGAADSIADIVAAATLIARLDIDTLSLSALPLGSGRIETAHGVMPGPAPAVSILLQGFETIDDGIPGERITPTGAAILRYLEPVARPPAGRLAATGYGFGSRSLPGISNSLRATLFEIAEPSRRVPHRMLAVIAFEIDDQSGEDLAAGIDRIRAHAAVHDVIQLAAIGKKGRLAVQLQVLADDRQADDVADLCFRETTTIGLRIQRVEARALVRRTACVSAGGHDVTLKIVERPGGDTAKPESDDILHAGDAAARAARRAQALLAAERTT